MITEPWVVPILTLLLTITWAIIHLTKARNQHQPPPLPPGPKGLPIIGNLLSLDPQLHSFFVNLAQAHGPIFSLRLGNKLGVVISSPPLVKQVLKDHDVIFANRDVPAAGRAATYGGIDIVWSPYGATWRMLRKVCVRELLSAFTLEGIYELRRQEIRGMVVRLSEKSGIKVVNVGEEIFLVVMKVVTEMLWGGHGEDEEERETIGSEFRAAVMELTGLLGVPNLSDFFSVLGRFDFQGVVKRMKKCAKLLDEIFEKVIDQRLRFVGEKKDKDFLDVCLKIKEDYGVGGGEGRDDVSFTRAHVKALLMV